MDDRIFHIFDDAPALVEIDLVARKATTK